MAEKQPDESLTQNILRLEQEISELRRTKETYRESETRYRTLFEEAGDGIFILKNGIIADCNQKTEALFGYPRDQVIGKTPFDLSPPVQPDGKRSESEATKRISAALKGEDQYFEWRHIRRNGLMFYAEVSLKRIELNSGTYIQAIMRDITRRKQAQKELEKLKERLQEENIYLQEEIRIEHNFGEIIGQSYALKKVMRNIEQVADTDTNVLVMGETGTGKELVARAIHGISRRKDRPLVKVNCAALPENLIESELFGHEKGAFTGALAQRAGRFELADRGTLFLDEIGDLPLALQVNLLRVLQEGEFERVGGSRTYKVDVRIIAATNRDLESAVEKGAFREDLFYRLNVFPIHVPPLRDRKEDIPVLVRHFIIKYGPKTGKQSVKIPQKTLNALMAYDLPGNVRELENIIERALIVSQGDRLELEDWLPKKSATRATREIAPMEQVEREHIMRALKMTHGRVSGEKGAAKVLGLNPHTLFSRIKKLGVARKVVIL
ncbi:MAG: sigma 54-interacting transcriptional regulator [Deltaproteobacteria bacterium]|nr:sigma 54-interacting transcriptional regulator [Deltaproteobacteria bacterium]